MWIYSEDSESSCPELAGFVFWSDSGPRNAIGNEIGPEFRASPEIVILD
jgi:hypothetical protein